MLFLEGRQYQWHQVETEGRDDANVQRTCQRILAGLCQHLDGIALLHHLPGTLHIHLADRGDLNRAIGTLEKGHPQLFLQLPDLSTQGRLTDKTTFRRPAKMPGICHRNDLFQIAQIHALLIIGKISGSAPCRPHSQQIVLIVLIFKKY